MYDYSNLEKYWKFANVSHTTQFPKWENKQIKPNKKAYVLEDLHDFRKGRLTLYF